MKDGARRPFLYAAFPQPRRGRPVWRPKENPSDFDCVKITSPFRGGNIALPEREGGPRERWEGLIKTPPPLTTHLKSNKI